MLASDTLCPYLMCLIIVTSKHFFFVSVDMGGFFFAASLMALRCSSDLGFPFCHLDSFCLVVSVIGGLYFAASLSLALCSSVKGLPLQAACSFSMCSGDLGTPFCHSDNFRLVSSEVLRPAEFVLPLIASDIRALTSFVIAFFIDLLCRNLVFRVTILPMVPSPPSVRLVKGPFFRFARPTRSIRCTSNDRACLSVNALFLNTTIGSIPSARML